MKNKTAYMVESSSFCASVFESWQELVETLGGMENPKVVLPIKISMCSIMGGEEDGSRDFGRDR